MVKYFQDNRVPVLQEIAFTARPAFVESKSVWIELPKLNDPKVDPNRGFLTELQCQPAEGVAIHLGAHPVTEIYTRPSPTGPVKFQVGLQLTLILLPMKKATFKGESYYYHLDIEDTPGYAVRSTLLGGPIGGGNTFNPCPPATGCQPSVGNP
jgi:hypothetical protein